MRNFNSETSNKFQPHKTYGTLVDEPLQHDRSRRHVLNVNGGANPSVAYFPGRSRLHRTTASFSSCLFTVELWVKPEGGQHDPAVIIAAGQTNSEKYFEAEWSLGVKLYAKLDSRKTVFYFSSQTSEVGRIDLHSPNPTRPEEWTHLAVSSSHGTIRLYVNGLQVAVRHDSKHELSRRGVQCDTLILGGNEKMSHGYRGMVDNLIVWSHARPQPDIAEGMYNFKASHLPAEAVVGESFDDFVSWASVGEVAARKWSEETPVRSDRVHFPEVRTPPCGQTVCDNPDIVKNYAENWWLRKPKSLRYNIVNINNGEGGNPMFTISDVMRQATLLKDVFDVHNITWIPSFVHLNDSGLRRKTIGCEPTKIGNRQCNIECNHERMGRDGGDCDSDETLCEPHKKGDQHCDAECNKVYHEWDLGDCCDPRYTDTDQTCFDPASPHRGYLSVTEYKTAVGADNSRQLSVLFANWSNPNSIGISTFPWDKEVFTSQGGTIVQLRQYSTPEEISSLVHEMGHNLGLLHVHHGSHNLDCDDLCAELEASLTTGDLCEDTNPTPMNTLCDEPTQLQAVCRNQNFTDTPYTNFMSYADGSCQDNFTPQQRARMHCYIDLFYGGWTEGHNLAPIPLSPKVVATSLSPRSITIAWAPPIDGRLVGSNHLCHVGCGLSKRMKQYASSATSPGVSGIDWSANQATGPPDQAACTLRGMHFWMPAWTDMMSFHCDGRCSLELGFEHAVVPSILRIWFPYDTEVGDGTKSIELLHEDNSTTAITGLYTACDTPLSVHVNTNKLTRKVRINVNDPFSAIDAVEMISKENDPKCSGCRRIKYKIHRDPPFPKNIAVTTEQLDFTDKSCEEGITYSYSIQPTLHPHHGEVSPSIRFRLGQTFCGDGKVQDFDVSEQCDDGNNENEDGCDSSCHVETGFQCKGEPSLCYWHEGDGICEEFEEIKNSPDCAEPLGGRRFIQWASKASSSSAALETAYSGNDDQPCSSTRKVLGPPDSTCTARTGAWSPCQIEGRTTGGGDHWIKVHYDISVVPESVLIYVPGSRDAQQTHSEVFTLLLPEGESVFLKILALQCAETPVVLNIPHTAGRKSINELVIKFGSASTAIDAIALASNQERIDPEGPSSMSLECVLGENFRNSNVSCHVASSLSVHASVGSLWPNQTECVADCLPGYTPTYKQQVTCLNGVWDLNVKCLPISCGNPSHIKLASFSCQSGHTLNSVCNFTCWRQARMIGTDNVIFCGEDGSWSRPTSYCEPMCGLPPNIGFASAMCDTFIRQASKSGDTCKYRCKPGYHVTQQPLIRRSFRLTCAADGGWKGPGCQPVRCPSLPIVYRGSFKCTRGFIFGSECTISCQQSNSPIKETVRCDSNGRWNATFSRCPGIPTSCKFPIAPPRIEITCDGLNTGQTCKATCDSKGGLPTFDIFATSDSPSDTPKPDARVRVLVCTGDSWFPNPAELYCVEPCDSHLIGDKWCDAVNNRAQCSWDGGDCCASTVRGKRAGRPEISCESECDCKDPRAESSVARRNPGNLHPRRRNRILLSPLRAAASAKISSVANDARDSKTGGRRHKKKRRHRDRHEALRTSRPVGDDSRRKHKHRRKHSGEGRRPRKRHRRYRG